MFDNFYNFDRGDYGYTSNPVTPRNPFQHPEITDAVYGAPGTEPGICLIEVTLWDTQGTASAADDIPVSTTDSVGDGSYSFSNIPAGSDYKVRVDGGDSDLPSDSTAGHAHDSRKRVI